MDREALVYVDLDGVPHLMGRLWARTRKNKESATFEYDKTWLENPARFSLEPALQIGPGPFHTPADTPMFGAIGDSAPDRWGRALMRRMERRRAEREGGAPRTLREIDFLLLVDDEARQGAMRFAEKEGGPFLREEGVKRIPPLIELPKLLSAAEHVMEEKDTEEELRMLFAPGSSLGGARPKASVREKDAQSCSEWVWFEVRFRAVIGWVGTMPSAARTSSRKSSQFQVESPGYSTVTGYAGSYLQLRNPGIRRTRLQSVQAGSPPKVTASCFSALSCCSKVKPSTRQRIWYLPRDVERTAFGGGTASEARSEESRASPSVSKSR